MVCSSAQLVGAAHRGVAGLHGGLMENCASWQITGIASATTRRSEALPQHRIGINLSTSRVWRVDGCSKHT